MLRPFSFSLVYMRRRIIYAIKRVNQNGPVTTDRVFGIMVSIRLEERSMIHTVTIARRVSRPKMETQGSSLFEAADIRNLLAGSVDKIEASTHGHTGINEIKAYAGQAGLYTLQMVVNLQTLATGAYGIGLFDCSQQSIQNLSANFASWLECIGFTPMPPVEFWWARRVDYAIDVPLPGFVPHYVVLAKRGNRPARFIDECDKDGSAYPESKSVTLNFYDKADQVAKEMQHLSYYDTLYAQAQNIFRLEVQCETDKLKSLRRAGVPDQTLGSFMSHQLAQTVVRGYYDKVLGQQDFHSLESAQDVVDAYQGPCMGAAARRNFMSRLHQIAAYATLPEAKAAVFGLNRSSWGDFLRRCRTLNINPVTIPEEWGLDTLPNPRP